VKFVREPDNADTVTRDRCATFNLVQIVLTADHRQIVYIDPRLSNTIDIATGHTLNTDLTAALAWAQRQGNKEGAKP
jgi:hypothetical protein